MYSDHSLPYSGYLPNYSSYSDSNYPGISAYPGTTGYSAAGPYSSSANYGGDYSAGPSNAYLPPSNSYLPPSGSGVSDSGSIGPNNPSNSYLPPSGSSNTYNSPPPGASVASRAMGIGGMDVSDLIFRFLGVDTMDCRMRFVCELEYRTRSNPLMGYAFEYIG